MKRGLVDLTYLQAATILARVNPDVPLTIVLAGCGGTGSYMSLHVGRILRSLSERGQPARAIFVDPDIVEPKNIGRQLFCEAEVGLYKSQCLALRYGAAWGLDITAVAEPFKASSVEYRRGGITVIVGCVDNAAGRKEMAKAVSTNWVKQAPHTWWLDCGNHEDSGQVIIGTATKIAQIENSFQSRRICQALPAPSMISPELLRATRAETSAKKMSCAELTAANLQSLNINAAIAAQAADMLTRLLVTRDLKRYQCAVNLASGSVKSYYCTPEEIAREIGKPVGFVMKEARAKAA